MKRIPVVETVAACVSILDGHLLMTLSKREVGARVCVRGASVMGREERGFFCLFFLKWRVQT